MISPWPTSPRPSRQQQAPRAVLDAIAKGAEDRGDTVERGGPGRLTVETGMSVWSFQQTLEVEVSEHDGGATVHVHASTFGVGPLVKQGPKKVIAAMREDAGRA